MTITINCIGVGHWGPNLVRNFVTQPDTRVGVVCDLSQARLDLVKSNIPGIGAFSSDPRAAATDPAADAVMIATPVASHYELTKQALLAGKHVLVEKPLCRSVAQAEELIDLADKQGVLLCVGHVFLFNNGVRAVRDLIKSGQMGHLRYVYSTRTNLGPFRSDVNALWDLASHDLSIVNYWLDADPLDVTARGAAYLNSAVEDVVVASFTYPEEVLVSVHASWLNPRKVREITVVGDHMMAVWNDTQINEPVRIYHKSVDVEREPTYTDSFGAFQISIRHGDIVTPHISGHEPLAAECRHFTECILGRAEPINSAKGSLGVLAALEAADKSMRQQSAVVKVDQRRKA